MSYDFNKPTPKAIPNVWEEKDLRIAKMSIVKSIYETDKEWGEKQLEKANLMLAYIYSPKGDKVNEIIKQYEGENLGF